MTANHTVVSGENLIFSWLNHVKKNPGLYTAMKSAVTLYLVCKLQKKNLVISLGFAGSAGSAGLAVPRSAVPQISATLNISIIQTNIFLAIQGEAEVGDIAVLISFLHTNSGVHPISCITCLTATYIILIFQGVVHSLTCVEDLMYGILAR